MREGLSSCPAAGGYVLVSFMADSTPLTIANADARRLFLDLHGLSDSPLGRLTAEGCQAVVDRIGFVQVDSINTVERAHHMILFARRHGYAQTQLPRLVEKTRGLFEGWTHDASLIPTRFFPYWSRRFADVQARAATSRWWTEAGPDFPKVLEQVRDRVATEGPLLTRSFEEERQRPSGGWWDWTPSKMALEFLWRTGVLAVARRESFQKVYDLTERVIPEPHRGPAPDPEAVVDWACRSALERLGIGPAGRDRRLLGPDHHPRGGAVVRPPGPQRRAVRRPCPGRGRQDRRGLRLRRHRGPAGRGGAGAGCAAGAVALRPGDPQPPAAGAAVRLRLPLRGLRARGEAPLGLLRLPDPGGRPPGRPDRHAGPARQRRPRRRRAVVGAEGAVQQGPAAPAGDAARPHPPLRRGRARDSGRRPNRRCHPQSHQRVAKLGA